MKMSKETKEMGFWKLLYYAIKEDGFKETMRAIWETMPKWFPPFLLGSLLAIGFMTYTIFKELGSLSNILFFIGTSIIPMVIFYKLMVLGFEKSSDNVKLKIIKWFFITALACVPTGFLLIETDLFWLCIRTQLLCLMMGFLFIHRFKPKFNKKKNSLEDRIKRDLKLVAKTYKKDFPRPVKFIGGFITPALPTFLVLNKQWVKHRNKEALLHEHVHLYYLQNGAYFIYLFIGRNNILRCNDQFY